MSPFTLAILLVLLGALRWFIRLRRPNNQKDGPKLPPGPRGLPIIGNLHMLGKLPHRTLHQLSQKYGPIMFIRLGYVPTIVVSSPQAAELFLKTHDTVFASRPKLQASQLLSYGSKGVVFSEYGPYWRNVKKFCTQELLSTIKIDSWVGMRREEVDFLVKSLKAAAVAREAVDLSEKVAGLIEDMTYRMLFGRNKDVRFDLKGIIQQVMFLAGAFNLADYVPFLEPLDLQGFTRRFKATNKVIDNILEIIIDEHEQDGCSENRGHDADFVDVLLALKKKSTNTHAELSQMIDGTNIKAIILDMIGGAVDTSHSAIEWVMSELLRHPRVMIRLQEELRTIVGVDRMVEESDFPKLGYLDIVVKESLRLHPVAPLFIHESTEDIVIHGYFIPNKARIIINSWAVGRDPNVWENVEEFLPERFIGSNLDLKGRDFQLIPFGSGRRGCPGMHLGLINVKLVVSQLVHCFNWELPKGMSPGNLDMAETFGITIPRANHLVAIPTSRL